MFAWLIATLLLASREVPVDILVRPGVEQSFTAVFAGAAGTAGGGAFSGTLSLNGSPQAVPVAGTAQIVAGKLALPLTLRYADVPEDWAARFRPESFDYQLAGRLAGSRSLDWRGTKRWDAVEVDAKADTAGRFVKLRSLTITRLSFGESEAVAHLAVQNPFGFPLKLARTQYRLAAAGRSVGEGATRGMMLRPGANTLQLPIELDHGELIAAAGRALLSQEGVDARLTGSLVVRLPRGDVTVPLDVSGQLSQ